MRILVIGATGFIGNSLCTVLEFQGHQVERVVRNVVLPNDLVIDDHNADTVWKFLRHDVVVHLAARAHVVRDSMHDSLSSFRTVSVDGTLNLVRQAALAGLKGSVAVSISDNPCHA